MVHGRTANPEVLVKDGYYAVSSSNIPDGAGSTIPEPLDEGDIWTFIDIFVQAAKNATVAGCQ